MKKIIGFIAIMIVLCLSCAANAAETPPEFKKKQVTIFYDVSDLIIMCQNESENMEKGKVEFEGEIKKYYSARYDVMDIKRAQKLENGKYDKTIMFGIPEAQVPLLLIITLEGNGSDVDTYQNIFGAKQSITVETTKVNLGEYIGSRDGAVDLWGGMFGIRSYRPLTSSFGGNIFIANKNQRTQTKNAIKGYLKDINSYNPPNKYTKNSSYEWYILIYQGKLKEAREYLLRLETEKKSEK